MGGRRQRQRVIEGGGRWYIEGFMGLDGVQAGKPQGNGQAPVFIWGMKRKRGPEIVSDLLRGSKRILGKCSPFPPQHHTVNPAHYTSPRLRSFAGQ